LKFGFETVDDVAMDGVGDDIGEDGKDFTGKKGRFRGVEDFENDV
jgi:hypothetical protein